MSLGFKTAGRRMDKIRAIPEAERCRVCAGFGFVYRCNPAQTEIMVPRCGPCGGTGRKRGKK